MALEEAEAKALAEPFDDVRAHQEALDAARKLYEKAVEQDVKLVNAAEGALEGFSKAAGVTDLSVATQADILIAFGSLLGILSEQPEVMFNIVDAFTVLTNGEKILFAAAGKVLHDAVAAEESKPDAPLAE
jgi:hypothetical protein